MRTIHVSEYSEVTMEIDYCAQSYCTRAAYGLASMPVLCAWCLAEHSLPFGEGSHGICPAHAAIVKAQSQAGRATRQRRTEEQ